MQKHDGSQEADVQSLIQVSISTFPPPHVTVKI